MSSIPEAVQKCSSVCDLNFRALSILRKQIGLSGKWLRNLRIMAKVLGNTMLRVVRNDISACLHEASTNTKKYLN